MRTKIFTRIFIFCFSLIFLGLFYLQILNHEKYRTMAEENRLRVRTLKAPRGSILDRNGEALVEDVLHFDLLMTYERVKDLSKTAEFLSEVLGVSDSRITEEFEKASARPHLSTVIASDLAIEYVIAFKERSGDFPGLRLEPTSRRNYLHNDLAAHLIGFLGQINREEYDRLKFYGYRIDDLIGRDGVEKYYEQYLQGDHGGKQIEVDNRGRIMEVLGYKQPKKGKDIRLTIDLELQKYCEELLEGKKGSIIAMEPNTGEILAMASNPSYSPGIFIDRGKSKERLEFLRDADSPMVNRAISSAHPPGSVFKLPIALAALNSGKVDLAREHDCEGVFHLGRASFRCWFERGHGRIGLSDSLKTSCNVYFYKIGLETGVSDVIHYCLELGLGELTGIDLPNEKKGLLPSASWKRERFGEPWYRGDTVNLSIGQGYVTSTPLQLLRMAGVFASKGRLVQPHVVKNIAGMDTGSDFARRLDIRIEYLNDIREGMRKAVNLPRGTAVKAQSEHLIISGKTGTAQAPQGDNHGWFVGFAPFDEAELVVIVFDEHGGKGGYFAAGTGGKVFEEAVRVGLLESRIQNSKEG